MNEKETLKILDRCDQVFENDINSNEAKLSSAVASSRFLVIGGAGSIGQAVVKEIFKRKPKKLHVVDINENNIVELVRDIRSSIGYISGEFKTFVLDVGSFEYDAFFLKDGKYDYVLNLSALKHVRSEKDPYTLMRLINVNIFNTKKTLMQSAEKGVKKYFCVSSDKATNPANMMGASKKIMEMFLMEGSKNISVSTARFANVAFSDGSLLHSFTQRIQKKQPLVAPKDVQRYFVTAKESGQLCLMSCIFGENRDIYFPKLNEKQHLIRFSEIALRYLKSIGFQPILCKSEQQARDSVEAFSLKKKWPCLFQKSNTTGEKLIEEFYTSNEKLDFNKFQNIGIIKNDEFFNNSQLDDFCVSINKLKDKGRWKKEDLVKIFFKIIPDFNHMENGRYLDDKM